MQECKFHIFATISVIFLKESITFRHGSSINVHVYQFSAKSGLLIGENGTDKFIAQYHKLHKLATTNSNF